MEQDKMREQFTAWLAKQEQEQLEMGNERFTGTEIGCMSRAWNAAWQASRAALVVELPTDFETYGMSEEAARIATECCAEAIHAAGITIKP